MGHCQSSPGPLQRHNDPKEPDANDENLLPMLQPWQPLDSAPNMLAAYPNHLQD